jgi:hypothetical protein
MKEKIFNNCNVRIHDGLFQVDIPEDLFCDNCGKKFHPIDYNIMFDITNSMNSFDNNKKTREELKREERKAKLDEIF